jgi:glycosyltransferase involved in cell wall biosynthesis
MKSAVCLIVKNEVRDIAEWIAFQALVGFDAVIIFDNCSDDGTERVIRAASGLHDIRSHYWPNRSAESQTLAYQAACEAYRLEFDWIAFIDSDEFLIPSADMPVNAFLAGFERWSGVAVHWAVYGSNGHEAFPPGLVLEDFTRRAAEDFVPARHVKSIIRPGFVNGCINPHCFDLRGHIDGSYCDAQGRHMLWWLAPERGGVLPGFSREAPDYSVARVNHYFTRSRAHWLAKLRRGYPSDVAVRQMDMFDEYDRNEIDDPIARRYLPALREGIARIQARL